MYTPKGYIQKAIILRKESRCCVFGFPWLSWIWIYHADEQRVCTILSSRSLFDVLYDLIDQLLCLRRLVCLLFDTPLRATTIPDLGAYALSQGPAPCYTS